MVKMRRRSRVDCTDSSPRVADGSVILMEFLVQRYSMRVAVPLGASLSDNTSESSLTLTGATLDPQGVQLQALVRFYTTPLPPESSAYDENLGVGTVRLYLPLTAAESLLALLSSPTPVFCRVWR